MDTDKKIVEFVIQNSEKLRKVSENARLMDKLLFRLRHSPDLAMLESIEEEFDDAWKKISNIGMYSATNTLQIIHDQIFEKNFKAIALKIFLELKESFPKDKNPDMTFDLVEKEKKWNLKIYGPVIKKTWGIIGSKREKIKIKEIIHIYISRYDCELVPQLDNELCEQIIETFKSICKKYRITYAMPRDELL